MMNAPRLSSPLFPAALALSMLAPFALVAGSAESFEFGKMPDGRPVKRHVLKNGKGMEASIIDFGCTVSELHVPDREGKTVSVVTGSDQISFFLKGGPSASVMGRVVNRIGGARFTLDGKEVSVTRNSGKNQIHGGASGFDKKLWSGRVVEATGTDAAVEFTLHSPDGDEGFPGNLDVIVRYTLTEKNELKINYRAHTDKPTPVNLTNHAYFNLSGSGDILDHVVTINADRFTPADADLIPSGEILSLAGTPFDFREPLAVGARYLKTGHKPGGYDNNYVLPASSSGEPIWAARVWDPKSGRTMEVLTTEPAVQLYTANHFSATRPVVGLKGATFGAFGALCFETQKFPDSVNHPNFPDSILRPGKDLDSTTVYRFGVK